MVSFRPSSVVLKILLLESWQENEYKALRVKQYLFLRTLLLLIISPWHISHMLGLVRKKRIQLFKVEFGVQMFILFSYPADSSSRVFIVGTSVLSACWEEKKNSTFWSCTSKSLSVSSLATAILSTPSLSLSPAEKSTEEAKRTRLT